MPPSPKIVLIVIVVLFIIITVIYWKLTATTDPRFASYIQMLGVIGVVLAIVTFLYTSSFQTAQNNHLQHLDAQEIDTRTWINMETQFMNNPNLLRLYKQLYIGNPVLQALPDPSITSQVISQEINMCQILFEIMDSTNEYVTDNGTWADPENRGWLQTFRSWVQSPLLMEQWQYNKQFYDQGLQAFINILMKGQ